LLLGDKIASVLKDPLENKGYDLVKVDVSLGSRAAVEVFIDRFDNQPVSIDDCVAASQLASAILDVEDLIQGKYNLNVSSPGESRPLRTEKDFERFCGNEIIVELLNPSDEGKKKFRGTLIKIEDSIIYLKEAKNNSSETKINFSDIKKASVRRVFKI
jgi:ribosome maturation factor RimP